MSRFDYVQYDAQAQEQQIQCKVAATMLENKIDEYLTGAAKQNALRSLEECYMWIGKGIRDEQIKRNGSAPLMEERAST